MERGDSMRGVWACLLSVMLALLGFHSPTFAQQEGDQLVLVTHQTTGVKTLTSDEVRRLFLGQGVTKRGKQLEVIINQSDPLLYQVFLQKVVFMSSQAYERRLLENVIQLGGRRPKVRHSQDALVADLHKGPGKISFIWNSQLRLYPALVVVGETWQPPEQE